MKEPKDKRTKEYKQWKANLEKDIQNKSAYIDEGLGDKIEKITTKTGIKKVVKKVFGDDCGCNERKEKLNKRRFRFPIVRCFDEKQFNTWKKFRKTHLKGTEWLNITRQDQIEVMIPLYSHLFARKLKVLNCCLDQYLNEIDKVYNNW